MAEGEVDSLGNRRIDDGERRVKRQVGEVELPVDLSAADSKTAWMDIRPRLWVRGEPSDERGADRPFGRPLRSVRRIVGGIARVVIRSRPHQCALRRGMHELKFGVVQVAKVGARELLQRCRRLLDFAIRNRGLCARTGADLHVGAWRRNGRGLRPGAFRPQGEAAGENRRDCYGEDFRRRHRAHDGRPNPRWADLTAIERGQ